MINVSWGRARLLVGAVFASLALVVGVSLTASAPASAATLTKMKVGYLPAVNFAPVLLGKKLGAIFRV